MIHTEIKNKKNEDICLLLRFSNHSWNYLCECGMASNLTAGECNRVQGIFISHTHIDHFANFDAVVRNQLGTRRTIVICGPEGISRNVQARLLSYTWNLIGEDSVCYEVRELLPDNRVNVFRLRPPAWQLHQVEAFQGICAYENEVFSVTYALLDHDTSSVLYLFKEHDRVNIKNTPFPEGRWIEDLKQAFRRHDPGAELMIEDTRYRAGDLFHYLYRKRGFRVAVIMDHAISEANHRKICTTCDEADEAYIECYYRSREAELALLNSHSTALASGRVARLARVKKLVPVHFSKRYQEEELTELIEECLAEFERES